MEFGLLQDASEPIFVANLDEYFTQIYNYWYQAGFATICVSRLVHLFTLAFTIGFSSFIFALVDWRQLVRCNDEQSCGSFSSYTRWGDFAGQAEPFRDTLAVSYMLVFGVYWVWSCYASSCALRDAWEIKAFYQNELGFPTDRELRAARWNEVVARLAELQKTGRAPWRAFHTSAGHSRGAGVEMNRLSEETVISTPAEGEEEEADRGLITAHDIACRIMRKENYLIAMLNAGILELRLPLLPLESSNVLLDALAGRLRLTKTLEWSIKFCILDHVFSKRFAVRRAFLEDELALKRRFMYAGLVHVALMPFCAVFMIMHFFLLHAQEWRDKKHYLGPREWSPVARWSFREINELPHIFERRLALSKSHADDYLELFPRPVVAALARCAAFVSGALVATLVALAAILDGGDAVLLYVKIGDRNLLWYAGVASAAYAVARGFVPAEGSKHLTESNVTEDAEQCMKKIAECTHCFPAEWRGACHEPRVRDALARAYRYKATLFADEVLAVAFAPLVLCFSLPRSATSVLEFIRDNSVEVDGLGSVLGHSLFDFGRYGDARYGSPHHTTTGQPTQGGKMEKSFLNFKQNYPEWRVRDPEGAEKFLDTVRAAQPAPHRPRQQLPPVTEQQPSNNNNAPFDMGLSFEWLDEYAGTRTTTRQQQQHRTHHDTTADLV